MQLRGDQIGPGLDRGPVPVVAVPAAGGPEEPAHVGVPVESCIEWDPGKIRGVVLPGRWTW